MLAEEPWRFKRGGWVVEPSTCYVGRHLRSGEASTEEERHPSGIQRLQGSPTGSGVAKGRDLFREESLDQFTIYIYNIV